MARVYCFYAFDPERWLSKFGSGDESLLQRIRFSKSEAGLARSLIMDERSENARREESGSVRYFAEQLLVLDQDLAPSPMAEAFANALSQECLAAADAGGRFSIDRKTFASTPATKAVAFALGRGRGIQGRPSRHNTYGYLLAGDEVRALLDIVRSDAWKAYTAPGRYRPQAVPTFERHQAAFAAWLEELVAENKGIYFAGSPVRGAKKKKPTAKKAAAKKKAPAAKKKATKKKA